MKTLVGLLAISLSFSSSALALSVLSSVGQDDQVEPGKLLDYQSYALVDATCTSPGNCNSSADYYAELERLFAEGAIPGDSEVVGWYSGRCYFASARTTAKASLLIGFTEAVGATHGPLFPGTEVLKFFAASYDSKSADIFDNMTPAELEAEINPILESKKGSVQAACVADNSLSVSFGSQTKWQVRKARNYLLLKYMEGNDLKAYCYHFKKVT